MCLQLEGLVWSENENEGGRHDVVCVIARAAVLFVCVCARARVCVCVCASARALTRARALRHILTTLARLASFSA